MKYKLLFIILLYSVFANAQHTDKASPIPIELNIGNNRFGLQSLINKRFTPTSKLSFLSVTSFQSTYDNDITNLDFINNSQIGFNIYKGFSVVTGLSVNRISGLTPVVGLQYVFINKEILFLITPTFDLSKNLGGLTVFEYKPRLTEKLKFYSRFQALYNFNVKDSQHQRSYMQFRLGVDINTYQFGLSTNLDYYGVTQILKDNYGLFFRFNLQ